VRAYLLRCVSIRDGFGIILQAEIRIGAIGIQLGPVEHASRPVLLAQLDRGVAAGKAFGGRTHLVVAQAGFVDPVGGGLLGKSRGAEPEGQTGAKNEPMHGKPRESLRPIGHGVASGATTAGARLGYQAG
jgi:hypothetical protein